MVSPNNLFVFPNRFAGINANLEPNCIRIGNCAYLFEYR